MPSAVSKIVYPTESITRLLATLGRLVLLGLGIRVLLHLGNLNVLIINFCSYYSDI